MDKFTKKELEIIDLVRQQKTKSEIQCSLQTTTAYLNLILSNIFRKTDEFVGYKTERSKFDELRCYMRNNPTAFSPIPTNEELKSENENASISPDAAKKVVEQIGQNMLKEIGKSSMTIRLVSDIKFKIEGIKIE